MRPDIVPGAHFPDYELTDHATKRRELSELQGQHPMVLVLSRGGYCPKDRRQAELLVQFHREMEVGYCRLVTISTDNITLTNEYRSGVGAHWPFLSDAGRIVQKDLDIAEYTDPDHNPMIPRVIVLEPGLVVYKIYNGYWFFGRPTLEDLRQDLRAVTEKCGPDWDITTQEMRNTSIPMARLTRKHGESKIEIGVGIQAATDWADLRWPDFYVGYDRADNFASHGGEIWHKRPAYLSKLAEGLFRRIQELLRFDGRLPVTSG